MNPSVFLSRYLAMLLVLFLLTGCVGIDRPVAAPALPVPAQPESLPTSVVTLLPAATKTQPSSESSPLPTVQTPAPTQEAAALPSMRTPAPTRDPALQVALTPDLPPSQAWQDCSLAGGWIGCDPGAPALKARLAFFHMAGPLVAVLDLETPVAWAVPSAVGSADPRISWSPDAAHLLVAMNENTLALYDADSTPLGSLAMGSDELHPSWQPGGQLAEPETIHTRQGALARLEQAGDQRWQVVFESTPGVAPQNLALETEPSDRLYHLISFVPGTDLLLGQTYFAGNQAVMQGAQLVTLNVKTGERRDLEAMAPLGWQASFAWQPPTQDSQAGLLAFTDTGGTQIGLPTLSLINFATGELQRPLPQGVAVADLAWKPDSSGLAFAASAVAEVSPPEAGALYALPGIYLLTPESGEVQALTQPPASARDGLPAWTADGQWLLYARYFDSGALEVRAVQPGSTQDRLIVSGLTAECPSEGPGCPWGRWLAIATK